MNGTRFPTTPSRDTSVAIILQFGVVRITSDLAKALADVDLAERIRTRLSETTVLPEEDLKERTIFRLRTREGLDVSSFSSLSSYPSIVSSLDLNVKTGLLTKSGTVYRLTERGMEVCDSILADLV